MKLKDIKQQLKQGGNMIDSVSYTSEIYRKGEGWILIVEFSDNPYTMSLYNEDICTLQSTQNILDRRVLNFLHKKSDQIITSDLGLTYTKIATQKRR